MRSAFYHSIRQNNPPFRPPYWNILLHANPHSWGITMNYMFTKGYFPFIFCFLNNLLQVVANGFAQTGRMNSNDLWVVDAKDVIDSLYQVCLAAKHRRSFGKGTGSSHYWLFIMAGKCSSVVRATALRTMTMRKTSVNAKRRIHGPYRLAGLCRVDG